MSANDPLPANPSYTLRQLGVRDADTVYDLLELFSDVFQEPGTYSARRPGREYLERLLAADDCLFVVAELEGQVVAGLTAYELKKFEQERRELFIYDLAVHAEHRRRGLATAMIEKVKSIAIERGAYLVFVQSEADDLPSSTAYAQFAVPLAALHFEFSPHSGRRDA